MKLPRIKILNSDQKVHLVLPYLNAGTCVRISQLKGTFLLYEMFSMMMINDMPE